MTEKIESGEFNSVKKWDDPGCEAIFTHNARWQVLCVFVSFGALCLNFFVFINKTHLYSSLIPRTYVQNSSRSL